MAGNKHTPHPRVLLRSGLILGACLLLWALPPFHVVKNPRGSGGSGSSVVAPSYDAATEAKKIWSQDIRAGFSTASKLEELVRVLQQSPLKARSQYGVQSGLGSTYFFVSGSGRVISREGSRLRVALDESGTQIVELRVGPIFGNTVRDGCGLLNVNSFPGLQEFNALSSELNALVEREVLPALREKALPATLIRFTACAEAPEELPPAGTALLSLIPLKAEFP